MAAKIKRLVKLYNSIEDLVENEEWEDACVALEDVCTQAANDPKGYDLTTSEEDCVNWEKAGGDEICGNQEFPGTLYERWLAVLTDADLEWGEPEWQNFWQKVQKWHRQFRTKGLNFADENGGLDELQELVEQNIHAARSGQPRKRKARAEEEEEEEEAGDEEEPAAEEEAAEEPAAAEEEAAPAAEPAAVEAPAAEAPLEAVGAAEAEAAPADDADGHDDKRQKVE